MTVTLGGYYAPYASTPYSFVVPTIPANGSLLLILVACSSSVRSFTPSGGPTMTAVTPTSGTSSQSGHVSYAWTGTANISDSGTSISFAETGGLLKAVFLWAVISDPAASSPLDKAYAGTFASAATHTSPSGTTGTTQCIEIQAMFDSRGVSTPNTTVWTAPGSMTASSTTTATGSSSFVSGAIGYNTSLLSSGVAIGNDVWDPDQNALGSGWTFSIKTSAPDPVIHYVADTRRHINATTSVGGTASLTQTSGPTCSIVPGATNIWDIVLPDEFTEDATFNLALTGATTEVITVVADVVQTRLVYSGGDWV